jgi:prepilin-type N-terminal cleavage/methylation domain-containing protein/prepilin-type processing-associated H-X9-DG protein
MHKRRGFTLVELLVVIGIVVLLAGILMPVVGKARARANRTRCAAQLQDIGRLIQIYLGENKNTLPSLNPMPSFRPPLNNYPSLVGLLTPGRQGGGRVFQCPADQITQPSVGAPAGYLTYFAREGASYRWNAMLNVRASRITELRATEKTPLTDEYEPFHGRAGEAGAMNYLFADFHVDDGGASNLIIVIK